ncbi:flagellin N-methylase [Candidatus Methanoplasma termitum]|uniref:Flagellin N-methylase n=2 Tax=Candidatus Methanoplasma termitum TaxID=1577791 RepID=A0A0A7LC14_9ARCH|nr:flagellin N-methylase [Candidatus Methanoplasma termitum]
MRMANTEIDYSEVRGKKAECPDGCGLCCLCQPEVLAEERHFFEKNHSRSLVKSKGPEPYLALALKKGKGSCVFLNGRRCSVYNNRPTYCRQFPYHIYIGDKVKVELDLSCRGVWTGKGADAETEAKEIVAKAEGRIRKAVREAGEIYREFYHYCKEAGVMGDPEEIRASVCRNIDNFTDITYLGKVMEMIMTEPVMTLEGLKGSPEDIEELNEAAAETAMESLATDDPVNAPVYCDEKWNWNIFLADSSSGRIDWMLLDDDGDLTKKGSVKASDIKIRPIEPDGKELLKKYISLLNQRESFLGNVFSLMDENDYEDDMANAYYGCLCTTILDLMWRASMLDHFFGTGMGERGIMEAIIFFDMDRLDAPTIGAFV